MVSQAHFPRPDNCVRHGRLCSAADGVDMFLEFPGGETNGQDLRLQPVESSSQYMCHWVTAQQQIQSVLICVDTHISLRQHMRNQPRIDVRTTLHGHATAT